MLARCPFCGSDDVHIFRYVWVSRDTYSCQCRKCWAFGPVHEDKSEAERRWAEIPYLASRLSDTRYGDLPRTGSPQYCVDAPRLISELRG
jgi:hypothetical protein